MGSDTRALVASCRQKFLQDAEKHKWIPLFDPEDLERVKTDDDYVEKFIIHLDKKEDKVVRWLRKTLKWRKKFGVKDLKGYQTFDIKLFMIGAAARLPGRDKHGYKMLYGIARKAKQIRKAVSTDAMFKVGVYCAERFLEENKDEQKLSGVVDASGLTLSDVDIEELNLARILATKYYYYYPCVFGYAYVFGLGKMMHDTYKMLKKLLPEEAQKRIILVDKTTILEHVDPQYLPSELGGQLDMSLPLVPPDKFHEVPDPKSAICFDAFDFKIDPPYKNIA